MQGNIMGIDDFDGIAAGKNFVIYSFLGKQTYFEMSCLWYFSLEQVILTSFVRKAKHHFGFYRFLS